MWKSAGVPMMTEKDIQREQERIKMIRRRTTLERGGRCPLHGRIYQWK
jgi:hypothetical protein